MEKAVQGGELNASALPPLLLEPPKVREHGDLATNVAMLWAKGAKQAPRTIAETLLKHLEDPEGILARKEIAGPGFINFAFAPKFYHQQLRELDAGKHDTLDIGHRQRVQVEFASVNPTGPLHVGHGRVAVIGDVLARFRVRAAEAQVSASIAASHGVAATRRASPVVAAGSGYRAGVGIVEGWRGTIQRPPKRRRANRRT
jgi:arginyl-tRNA synthetase